MGRFLTIAFGNRTVRFGEISKGWTGIYVRRLFERELPYGIADQGYILDCEAAARFLRSAVNEKGIKTRKVIFIVPAGKVMTKEILLPKMNRRDILKTIKTNQEDYFPIDMENSATACFQTGEIEKPGDTEGKERRKFCQITALAASDLMIEAYYKTAAAAGFKVAALEYEGNSLFQFLVPQIDCESCAALRIKEDGASLSIFCGKAMVFQRNISISLRDQEEDTDRILLEIDRAVGYCQLERPDLEISRIYFAGWGKECVKIKDGLKERSRLPLCEISLNKGLNIHMKAENGEENKYIENIGAVLSPSGFLSKREEKKAERKREEESCRCLLLFAVLVSLIITAGPAANVLSLSEEKMELESRLLSFHGDNDIFEEYNEAMKRHEDAEAIARIVNAAGISPEDFINSLEQILPDGVSITSFSWNEGRAEISAVSRGKAEAALFVRRIKEIDPEWNVDISGLSSIFEDDGRETAAFSITCLTGGKMAEEKGDGEIKDEEFDFER